MALMARLRRGRRRRGMMVVEAAIVLPLMLLLFCGLLEYGWLFWKLEQMHNAARAGARNLATAVGTTTTAQAKLDDLMTKAGLNGSGYIPDLVDNTAPNPVTVTVTISPVAGNDKLDVMKVSKIANWIFPMPDKLQASVSMAKEG